MSETERALIVAGIAAVATLGAALIAAAAAFFAAQRDRRRVLYGEAVRAALGWVELLYRVRRRSKDTEPAIIERSHALQEQLTYYEGWIASESKFMARSYGGLVKSVKHGTEPLIVGAWGEKIRPVPGNAQPKDVHPTFVNESADFMRDVRAYLSPWQIRKIGVAWRNRKRT